MKRLYYLIFLILIALIGSCVTPVPSLINVTAINVPESIEIGKFDDAGIKLKLEYSNNEIEYTNLTTELLPEEQQELLGIEGKQHIEFFYKDHLVEFDVSMYFVKFKIIFTNLNDEVIKIQYVKDVNLIEYPTDEAMYVEGYKFLGTYDKDFSSISTDIVAKGMYVKLWTVEFYNNLNELLSTQVVEEGSSAVPPTDEEIYVKGYEFISWSSSFENVTEDLKIYGNYEKAHIHSYTQSIVKPSCELQGYTIYTCDCGDSYKDSYVSALGHDIVIDEAISATCFSSGLTEGEHCIRCDYKKEQIVIPALGHNYESTVYEPTCVQNGYTVYKCSYCGNSYQTDVVGKIPHNYNVVQTVPATCTEDGYTVYKCSYCGNSYQTDVVGKIPHNYNAVQTVPATCTEDGYAKMQCNCGDYYYETLEKYDHIESDWIIISKLSCLDVEVKHKECILCHLVMEEETQQALGHDFESNCCKRCGLISEQFIYSFDKYKTKITFGSYPQSIVTDEQVINDLEMLIENNANNNYYWNSYEYYDNGSNTVDYMWYKDLTLDNVKYRAVYFTNYRPYYADSNASNLNSYIDDNGYYVSTVYYFKYEPITWKVLKLDDESNKAFLVADIIVDSQDFNHTGKSFTVDNETIYGNNYEYSTIRQWLNFDFYYTAFNKLEQSLILSTIVDNSASTTSYPYNDFTCKNTIDKLFLLSYEEVNNSEYGFSQPALRQLNATDYAKVQGCYDYSYNNSVGEYSWWLRSPGRYSTDVSAIYKTGENFNISGVYCTNFGVVPALWITLDDEIDHNHEYNLTKKVEPTCTIDGYLEYTCYYCDDIQVEILPALSHKTDWIEVCSPTCENYGQLNNVCSRCNEILEEKKLAPLGHEIIVQKPVEPTCILNGYTYGEYCTRCDYSIKQEIVDPLGHTLETVVIEPTCEKEGYTIFTCYCGLSYVDLYINPLGHDLIINEEQEPTCTSFGYSYGEYCTRCEYSIDQVIIYPLGHDMYYAPYVEPTCMLDGHFEGSYCLRCDYFKDMEAIPALGHDIVIDESVEATCLSSGLTEGEHCTRCEYKIEQIKTPLIPHNYIDLVCVMCGKTSYTSGLSYTLTDEGYIVSGIGSAKENDIIIPAEYNGLPVIGIGYYAFKDVVTLHSITIPSSIYQIENFAFSGCKNLNKVFYDGTIADWCGIEFDGEYSNPMKYGDQFYLLNERTYIEIFDICIPGSVEKIGDYQFYGFNNIISVTLSNGTTTIGRSAFSYCSNLSNIQLSNTLTTIDYAPFSLTSITNINLPASVKEIDAYAFDVSKINNIEVDTRNPYYKSIDGNLYSKDGKSLVSYAKGKTELSFTIPYHVSEICDCAFATSNLQEIIIPNTVLEIGSGAFSNTEIKHIDIPSSISTIRDNAFNFSELQTITLPNSIITIEAYAFNASNLVNINLPSSLDFIDPSAFDFCSKLIEINISNNNNYKSIDGNLYSKDGKTLVRYAIGKKDAEFTVPSNVINIGTKAFSTSDYLTKINLPNGLVTIGDFAFSHNDVLNSIVLPSSLISIGAAAFSSCKSLTSILIPRNVTTIGYIAFKDCINLKIYCEVQSKPSGWYSGWNDSNCPVVWGI